MTAIPEILVPRIGSISLPTPVVPVPHTPATPLGESVLLLQGATTWTFPPLKEECADIQATARSRGWRCYHVGYGKRQHLEVSNEARNLVYVNDILKSVNERVVFRNYISLEGVVVDQVGLTPMDGLPANARYARSSRDGYHHHITILSPEETKTMNDQMRIGDILASVATIPDDWEPIRQGFVEDGDAKAFYTAVKWEKANEWRVAHGLPPADFHITMGFIKRDIHGVRKL